jgi:hypothetical protein
MKEFWPFPGMPLLLITDDRKCPHSLAPLLWSSYHNHSIHALLLKKQVLNPDCAVFSYCGLKILAATLVCRFLPAPGGLFLDILMNIPASQNRSNCAFRYGFLRLARDLPEKIWV